MAQSGEVIEVDPEPRDKWGFPILKIGSQQWLQDDLAAAIVRKRLTPAQDGLVRDFFWELGFKAVQTLLRTGEMERRSSERGHLFTFTFDDRRILREDQSMRADLAVEVVLQASPLFFDHLEYWRPEGGASLQTYFIGACIRVFKSAYAKWTRARSVKWLDAAALVTAPWLDPNRSSDFTDQVEVREAIEQVMTLARPSQRPILGLLFAGYSQAEAAKELGITARTVEGRMYQLRKRVMLAVAAGKISPPPGFTAAPGLPRAQGPVMI